jgi:hypothetical protein
MGACRQGFAVYASLKIHGKMTERGWVRMGGETPCTVDLAPEAAFSGKDGLSAE